MRPPPPPRPIPPKENVATLADLGITEDAWNTLDPESRRMIRNGCLGKVLWHQKGARQSAHRLTAAVGEETRGYRCPFTIHAPDHWHVGHVPTIETLAAIALAIRDLHGVRPTPVDGTPTPGVASSRPRRRKKEKR